MSGRGRRGNSRGGDGRFGRGRGRGRNNSSHSSKSGSSQKSGTTGRKTLADHVYSIGSAKQASDYSVITQFIINYIRKTFDNGSDIGDALEKRADITFEAPTLKAVSTATTNAELEAKQNEILYRALVVQYVMRVDKYMENKGKAFATRHCSTSCNLEPITSQVSRVTPSSYWMRYRSIP